MSGSKKTSSKWVKNIRGLASNPNDNDYLKIDYIEVNLNNSRKMIANINELAKTSHQHLIKRHEVNESLIKLETASANLKWLEEI